MDLQHYKNMRICVAVSGGRDSMALLHFLCAHGGDYGINVYAVNCNHKIRKQTSDRDTQFVKDWCAANGVELLCFTENCLDLAKKRNVSVETAARDWRRACFYKAAKHFSCGAVATAHHADDNAESVLFNLARGSSLAGVRGIYDGAASILSEDGKTVQLNLIRPLIACTREEINLYVEEHCVPYVDDESNTDVAYTRNRIRHNVLPELERAVPGAVSSVYRFSRLVAQTESYFDKIIEEKGLIRHNSVYTEIGIEKEDAIFCRAVHKVLQGCLSKKDFTYEHITHIANLRYCEKGKKFELLNLTAYRDDDKIVIFNTLPETIEVTAVNSFNCGIFGGISLKIVQKCDNSDSIKLTLKTLKFDLKSLPANAVIRQRKDGDKFTKFGGGTKSLGDFLTDKKVPVYLRDRLPVIAVDSEIYAVCGVEISEKIKITEKTEQIAYLITEIL